MYKICISKTIFDTVEIWAHDVTCSILKVIGLRTKPSRLYKIDAQTDKFIHPAI